MHSPEATPSVAIRECMNWVKVNTSKLEVCSQFNYARATIRRILGIESIAAKSKPRILKSVVAKVRTSIRRRWPKSWMIEGVQHFSLQCETKPLGDREVLGDRDVVVGVMGSVQPYSLAKGTGRCIRGNIVPARGGQVLGINECDVGRSLNRIFAN